jgi:hypothetical protein
LFANIAVNALLQPPNPNFATAIKICTRSNTAAASPMLPDWCQQHITAQLLLLQPVLQSSNWTVTQFK